MININWSWLVFAPVLLLLIRLTFKKYEGGHYYSPAAGLENVFFGLLLIMFVLVWGGVFWW